MTCEEAIQYIHSTGWHKGKPTLERIRALLALLGNPQEDLRFIHVAGTNGKGSTCAMLDSILRKAGYRVGLYTSPYIRNFRERIQYNGEMISEEDLASTVTEVKAAADKMTDAPTEFELITAAALLYYSRKPVDYIVFEVGLGGRLDPTNVISKSVLSIITGIDFDHTELLGDTIQKIAAEKAGIIKPGCPILFGGTKHSACRTIRAIAELRHSDFYTVDRSEFRCTDVSLDGTTFNFQEFTALRIPLLGAYQPNNAGTVLTAIRILREKGIEIPEAAIRNGLESVCWPARFELLSKDPVILYDGGHNPQGVDAAVKSIQLYFPEEKVNILSGVMTDKEYDVMIESLKSVTNKAFTVTPENPRALSAAEYAESFARHKVDAEPFASVPEALDAAVRACRAEGRPLICLGSLYLYRAVAEAVKTLS